MKTLFTTLIILCSAATGRAQCTTPPPQPGSIVGIDPVCAGSTQVYYIFPVAGATSYTWTLPNGWTGTSNTTSITVVAGSAGGWMYVTANNDCGSSAPQGYLAAVLDPHITASGPAAFCDGGSVLLNSNAGNGLVYQWYRDGIAISGAGSTTYTATMPGEYTVQASTNNCFIVSDPFTVTVNPNPDIPVAGNSSPVCVGAILDFSGACATPGVSYSWNGPNNFSNTQNPQILFSQAADAGVYTLTVTDGNCSASATTTVVMEDVPGVTSISGANPVCENSASGYSVPNDPSALQYNWTMPGGWNGTSTTNSIVATVGAAGGTISVYAVNNCGISDTVYLDVTVNPRPQPVIVISGNDLITTQVYASYQWYNTSGPIAGATNQSYTPMQMGHHFVVVTDSNGCVNQSNSFNIDGLSVSSRSTGAAVILYPSPNSGSFRIEGRVEASDGNVSVSVIDLAGRVVHTERLSVAGTFISAEVNLSHTLPEGLYTLKLHSDTWNSVIPFVKK